jgi:hypothetical protein
MLGRRFLEGRGTEGAAFLAGMWDFVLESQGLGRLAAVFASW